MKQCGWCKWSGRKTKYLRKGTGRSETQKHQRTHLNLRYGFNQPRVSQRLQSFTMRWLLSALVGSSILLQVSAQFQFFEQVFNQGGQQQQQQRQQNVASDSVWYQKTYEGGKLYRPLPHPFLWPKLLSVTVGTVAE